MRGSPPVQLAFLLLGFFILGVPLVRLTHGGAESVTGAIRTTSATDAKPVFVRIRYSQKPLKLEVKRGGENVLPAGDLTASPVEAHTTLLSPLEGLEFSVAAEWPSGTPDTALTIEVEPDSLDGRTQTLWSTNGRIEDIASFTWK
ncbi:MAG: hypothetical protein JWO08_2820 [Verrucomicrobiaceae bacterium]|nr:hypothetical protein [Verrucomicrobiaceae bacterium]